MVQPLRFPQHDVHQLRLLLTERQLLAQQLDRAGHRRQRIADLVCDAGGHLADRRETLPQPRLTLQPLHRGDVLEHKQVSGAPVRKGNGRDGQAEIDEPSIAQLVDEIDAQTL